jgi:hypothetical protein
MLLVGIGWVETFNVGADTGTPVVPDYAVRFRFAGQARAADGVTRTQEPDTGGTGDDPRFLPRAAGAATGSGGRSRPAGRNPHRVPVPDRHGTARRRCFARPSDIARACQSVLGQVSVRRRAAGVGPGPGWFLG